MKCVFLNVVSYKYVRTVSTKAIKLQYQTKTAGSFRNTQTKRTGGEEHNEFCNRKHRGTKMESLQYLAVLSELKELRNQMKRTARLKQKEIVIPQLPQYL